MTLSQSASARPLAIGSRFPAPTALAAQCSVLPRAIEPLVRLAGVATVLALAGPTSAQTCIEGTTVLDALEPARALTIADFDGDGDVDLGFASSRPASSFTFSLARNEGDRTPPVSFQNLGGFSEHVVSGDIDGDLDADLVFMNRTANGMSLYRNVGSGTFVNTTSYGGIGLQPSGAVLTDLDGDGDKDLAITLFGSNTVRVWRNSGGPGNTFSLQGTYPTGAGPTSVDGADLDGDGDVDLAVTSETAQTVSIYINAGDGTFASGVAYATGSQPSCAVTRDLDGDGDLDLAVSNRGSDSVSVLLNTGTGAFAAEISYAVGTQPVSLIWADVDGDGDADLATADRVSSSVSVLLNQGDGTFGGLAWYDTGRAPVSVRALDLDRDGHVDLAVACRDSESAWILWNRGDGTFPGGEQQAAGGSPNALAKADLDLDGDVDLVATNEQADTVSVLLNLGAGVLASPVSYPVGHGPAAVVTADFDGDGDADLAVASTGTTIGNMSVLLNQGGGVFAPRVPYTAGTQPLSLAAGDVDGDGDNDLVSVEFIISPPNRLRVLLNQGDGTFAAPVVYYVPLGTSTVVLADLDGDGDLDVAAASGYEWFVQLLRNSGNGTFTTWNTIDLQMFDAEMSMTSGDFDADGDVDLALAQTAPSPTDQGFVTFMWNPGNGAFPSGFTWNAAATGLGTPRASSADVDGDGVLDVLVTNADSNSVRLYSKFVNGLPTERLQVGVGFSPHGVLGADMDGELKIVTANGGSNTVSILGHCGPTGEPYCFGDGSGTACPCGNAGADGNGCATSFNPLGANLSATGHSAVSNDTLVLTGSGLSSSVVTFFQGTTSLDGGVVFGDGLRCAGGSIVRLAAVPAVAGVAQYPTGSAQPVSVRGGVPATSTLRHYQVWYRNAGSFCTPSTFNLSNGLTIHWVP